MWLGGSARVVWRDLWRTNLILECRWPILWKLPRHPLITASLSLKNDPSLQQSMTALLFSLSFSLFLSTEELYPSKNTANTPPFPSLPLSIEHCTIPLSSRPSTIVWHLLGRANNHDRFNTHFMAFCECKHTSVVPADLPKCVLPRPKVPARIFRPSLNLFMHGCFLADILKPDEGITEEFA